MVFEGARTAHTVILIFEILVQVVARRMRMELQSNVRNVALAEPRRGQPIESPQRFQLCCL